MYADVQAFRLIPQKLSQRSDYGSCCVEPDTCIDPRVRGGERPPSVESSIEMTRMACMGQQMGG